MVSTLLKFSRPKPVLMVNMEAYTLSEDVMLGKLYLIGSVTNVC